ncbi:hypothetical protein C5Z26_05000 [Lactobacillus sp. CBA3606]|uniref:hypothetical protein n=1 Tax=Lactobacillus sp. CBA3606 TaxID=2099789 RepID=UPI000CFBF21C|nr:hypothetical protein [Lactobacillus sp. CBA3606]AVK63498.1 hypothetical protein C5Z26_05000 [Lactobacillus sp. CBA3606]
MKKTLSRILIAILLVIPLYSLGGTKVASAADLTRVHFEFRWNNPNDVSYRQTKQTTSGYGLKSNTVNIPWYSATAWGHSYKAGKTGNVNVSQGHTYHIYANHSYNLYNKLVEWYGRGNAAYINASSHSNGHAYGYWHADH